LPTTKEEDTISVDEYFLELPRLGTVARRQAGVFYHSVHFTKITGWEGSADLSRKALLGGSGKDMLMWLGFL